MRLKILRASNPREMEEKYNKIHEQVKASQSHFDIVDNKYSYTMFCWLGDKND